jgi:uncharacterized membrane-anchored protein YjiN (DUF445 family)
MTAPPHADPVPVDGEGRDHQARTEDRVFKSDLARMRLIATGLLVLMAALFVATSALKGAWPWLLYPRAFAEAAIVGACADWFAVEAIFRRPFGLPIPHTGIIPRQKAQIGDAVGRFITRNFLAPNEVSAGIDRIDAAGWLANWLKTPANVRGVLDRSQGLASPLMRLLHADQVRGFSRSVIVSGIDSVALAPLTARTLSVMMAQGYFDVAFDAVLDAGRRYVEGHGDNIKQRVAKAGGRWLSGWIDARLSDAILGEVLASLAEARAQIDHPWRVQARAATLRFIVRLAEDPAFLARGEEIKHGVLNQKVVEGYIDWLSAEAEARIRDQLAAEGEPRALESALTGLGDWLEGNAYVRDLINSWARRLAVNAVASTRDQLGGFVSGVVKRWDAKSLADRLELQVGKDLQYIRVNGALVGGLVGLIIYTLSRLLG